MCVFYVYLIAVSFAGSLGVLVTIQLLMALSAANLVSRNDSPPSFLVWPLQGTLGNILCLSDLPLVGQVRIKILSQWPFLSSSLCMNPIRLSWAPRYKKRSRWKGQPNALELFVNVLMDFQYCQIVRRLITQFVASIAVFCFNANMLWKHFEVGHVFLRPYARALLNDFPPSFET